MIDETRDQPPQTPDRAPVKKPYTRPALRRLGSVRDLTAGGTSATRIDVLHMRTM